MSSRRQRLCRGTILQGIVVNNNVLRHPSGELRTARRTSRSRRSRSRSRSRSRRRRQGGDASAPFYCVAFPDIETEITTRLAKQGRSYVRRHEELADWRVTPPRSWSMYSIGPHVTVNHLPNAADLLGHRAIVKLGRKKHVDTGRSRWVMYDVDVQLETRQGGGVFEPIPSCGEYPCHISIAQQRHRDI